jgi:hypothetical protein
MIERKDILSLNFYKKEKFNGSYRGMRYRIEKSTDDSEDKNDIFKVSAWPGPYIYSVTPDEKKTAASFPFSEEGLQQITDWLNEQSELIK